MVSRFEDFGDADELVGVEDGSRVDFVGDEVDVFSGDEVEDLFQDVTLDGCAQRV